MEVNLPINITDWKESDLEFFIETNSSMFYAFACRYFKNVDDIEDIIQDCYLKLWRDRRKIGQLSSPLNYIFTMIKNNALNRISHNSRVDVGIAVDCRDTVHFYNNIIEAESSKIIYDAISSLSEQSREVMNLVLQGKKLDEIAVELNISVNSVKTVKARAMKRLASILPKELFAIIMSM